MFADTYDLPDFVESRAKPHRRAHPVFAALMFLAAYFTTITVQAQDAIVLGQKDASVTGTVKEADENWVIVTSGGKDVKIVLDDVDMQGEADTLFTPGMMVTADGRMKGDDFGVALLEAKTVTAVPTPPFKPLVNQQ